MKNNNWRQYLDEDYEDAYEKVERIPQKPRRIEDDKGKDKRKDSTKNDQK